MYKDRRRQGMKPVGMGLRVRPSLGDFLGAARDRTTCEE